MNFGQIIEALKVDSNLKAKRDGWNGKNMFIVLMPALNLAAYSDREVPMRVNDRTAKHIGEDAPLRCLSYFAMYTASGEWLPGWLASQSDMLAEDWSLSD